MPYNKLLPYKVKNNRRKIISEKVKSVFDNFNVPVLDVSKLTCKLSQEDLIVNNIDAHPSAKLHELVGNNLYSLIAKSQ